MNELKHIDEFKQLLADYHISEEGKQILASTKLVLFVGPTSSGRNTIINELLKTGKYHFIVSDTTRKPRENNGVLEQDGVEYWFRKEEDLLEDLRSGLFLEAAVIHDQQTSGISMRELKKAADNQKVAINEVEVNGADAIHSVKPDTLFLFVVPPSFDEWMARMTGRGALPEDEVRRRLTSAIEEISIALERDFYHIVVNDTFKQTTRVVEQLIVDTDSAAESQARGEEVARELLEDTRQYLAGRR